MTCRPRASHLFPGTGLARRDVERDLDLDPPLRAEQVHFLVAHELSAVRENELPAAGKVDEAAGGAVDLHHRTTVVASLISVPNSKVALVSIRMKPTLLSRSARVPILRFPAARTRFAMAAAVTGSLCSALKGPRHDHTGVGRIHLEWTKTGANGSGAKSTARAWACLMDRAAFLPRAPRSRQWTQLDLEHRNVLARTAPCECSASARCGRS